MAVLELQHFISTAEAVVHWRNHPGWNEHIDVANIPRYIDPSLFKLCCQASSSLLEVPTSGTFLQGLSKTQGLWQG